MSCQPFQLTDFGSQSSDVSDSDESVDSTTMEQSTDPHVATLAEPRLSKVCDVCHFLATREYDPGFYPHSSSDWQKFSRIRSSALAGRPCCRIIVDAIETWLRHANHKAYKAVHLGSGLLFNTLDVHLYIHRTGRYTLRPVVSLRWQRDNDGLEAEILRLIIFAPHGTPPQHATEYEFSRRYLPSGNTSSLQAFRCLENWITTCVHSHFKCNTSLPGYVPKRVLEITQHGIVLRENLSECIRYACLSHCWGADGVALKLTSATQRTFQHGLKLSILPKTFQDAVQICSRLQIPYLWIDALCIIQDDDDDWNNAVATMADIYENAYLTIAATASPNSNGGCFSDPNSTFRARKLDKSSLYMARLHLQDYAVERGAVRNLDHWPLMTRAWVFQERILSPRIVHFTDTQLLWECHSMMKSESGDIDKDWTHGDLEHSTVRHSDSLPFKYRMPGTAVIPWHTVVEDYSRLDLTFSKDRLPALAAIVQRLLKIRENDTYIAGLWRSSLLSDLTWHSTEIEKKPRSTTRVPSWSWASVLGTVGYGSHWNLTRARSIDISCNPRESQKKGYLDGVAIVLKCYSCAGYIRWTKTSSDPHFVLSGEDLVMPRPDSWGHITTDYDWHTGSEPVQDGDVVVIAVIEWGQYTYNWGGFVLRQVSEGNYERIGWCFLDYDYLQFFVSRKAKLKDNFEWRYYRSFVASLPVRSFRIV